eukprot:GHVT01013350.1.p1 GENE.GHVT01013350.1~~GHVT01013350.1.p1  ORF type:complete len:114 (-),score=2.86 GHVT01013350.1:334-675(-)
MLSLLVHLFPYIIQSAIVWRWLRMGKYKNMHHELKSSVFLVGLIKKKIILYRYPNLPKERNKKGVSGMIQTQANEQESYRIRVVLLCRLLTSIPCCSRFVSFYPVVLSSPSRP